MVVQKYYTVTKCLWAESRRKKELDPERQSNYILCKFIHLYVILIQNRVNLFCYLKRLGAIMNNDTAHVLLVSLQRLLRTMLVFVLLCVIVKTCCFFFFIKVYSLIIF